MSEAEDVEYAPRDYTITRNIPYQIRWKIMQMKLLLYDLKELKDKYNIESAEVLYEAVKQDITQYLYELLKMLRDRRKKMEVYANANNS